MTETPEVLNYVTTEYSPPKVAVLIKNASILEYEGELCPGVALTPEAARQVAINLIEWASQAENSEEEE